MKSKWLITVAIVTIAFWGCDYVSQPVIPVQTNSTLPTTPPTFRDSSTTYNVYKVLLEDCMGDHCPNCPAAITVSEGLLTTFGPQVVLMEENMGVTAVPDTIQGYPDSAFSTDYTSIAGNNWMVNPFNFQNAPSGYIDRCDYSAAGLYDFSDNDWQDTIQTMINTNPKPSVEINIHDSCWVPTRLVGVEFQLTFEQSLPGSYILISAITQDSVVSYQLDDQVSGDCVVNYVHRFTLRGAFDQGPTSGSGVAIPTAASGTQGGTWTSYQTYNFTTGENGKAATWNMAKCYIVAFVCNSSSNATPYQVVQAEMIKVE